MVPHYGKGLNLPAKATSSLKERPAKRIDDFWRLK
jgi:hypothetical protein